MHINTRLLWRRNIGGERADEVAGRVIVGHHHQRVVLLVGERNAQLAGVLPDQLRKVSKAHDAIARRLLAKVIAIDLDLVVPHLAAIGRVDVEAVEEVLAILVVRPMCHRTRRGQLVRPLLGEVADL